MYKKCIVTYITGNYDELIEPRVITPDWDYICITDTPNTSSKNWKVILMDNQDKHIECQKRRANSIVMQYYKYISNEYDICIFIDGNMEVYNDLNMFLDEFKFDPLKIDLMVGQHPDRGCVYKEAEEVIKLKKDDPENIKKHVNILKANGYPINNGLCESGVLVISRKSEKCLNFFSQWYHDYMSLPSKRDQMSLNYSIWKQADFNIKICKPNIASSTSSRRPFNNYFNLKGKHKYMHY